MGRVLIVFWPEFLSQLPCLDWSNKNLQVDDREGQHEPNQCGVNDQQFSQDHQYHRDCLWITNEPIRTIRHQTLRRIKRQRCTISTSDQVTPGPKCQCDTAREENESSQH